MDNLGLSKGATTVTRPSEEAGASGKAEDISHSESSKHLGEEHRGEDEYASYEVIEH